MKLRALTTFASLALAAGIAAAGAAPSEPPAKAPAKPSTKAAAKLVVGSPAPKLELSKWIKGESVSSFEEGKVYVVEFWATWCPPCVKSIPHLTKLQKQHKDSAVIIGVASSERGSDPLPKLEKFVKDKGAEMDYRIAFDPDRKAGTDYLAAAGVGTIPTAFVVDGKGNVAWFGNPLDNDFDKALETAVTQAKKQAKPSDKKPSPKTPG